MPPDGYKTVTVPAHVYDTLGDYAEREGLASRTQAVQKLLDGEGTPAGGIPAQDQLDRVESSLNTVEKRTNKMEKTLDQLTEGRR